MMTGVLILLAGLWVVAWVFGVAPGRRLALVGGAWGAVGVISLLPMGAALGGPRVWGALSVVAGLVVAYRAGLRRLRGRAKATGPGPADWGLAAGGAGAQAVGGVSADGSAVGLADGVAARPDDPRVAGETQSAAPFSPAELSRYARHILLREIGGPGQKALKQARVLVVGAGGLGAPALLYLAAAGVGTIGVIDDDTVDDSNLQRQVIHTTAAIGQPKVTSAAAAMRALNPYIQIIPHETRLSEDTAALLAGYDLVLDGCDNFDTRYLVNRLCHQAGKPLISAAITQWEGQISLFHTAAGTPCYQCCFPERPAPGMVPTCAEVGVAAPLPGILGSMMAMEAVKHLTGAGETLKNRLFLYDALYTEARSFEITRRPDCPICGAPAAS